MAYLYNAPNTTTGIDSIASEIVTSVPAFIPTLLFFIYFIVAVGGSVAQKRRTGTADLPVWSTIAGITTFLSALALTLADGLMNLWILGVVTAITIASGIWLFTSQGVREV